MLNNILHGWNLTPKEAVQLQKELASKIVIAPLKKAPSLIAGADVAYFKKENLAIAAVVVISLPDLNIIETSIAEGPTSFPYVPGLLSFRELPLLYKAFKHIKSPFDLCIIDGQGIAHPRGLGLASHLGLWLNMPTIGCAKSILVGTHSPINKIRWSKAPLIYKESEIGMALRTKERVHPVFISPGHLINTVDSIRIIKRVTTRFRLPEPTRLAHNLVTEHRKKVTVARGHRANISSK